MLKNKELRIQVIWLYHNILVAGHGKRWKMTELVIRNYWWLGVIKDIGKYMEEYDVCQKIKNRTEAPAEKLITNEVPEKLWIYLMVDLITKLPLVVEKNTMLVICNRLLKMAHFVINTEGIMVEGLARLFRDDVWKLHGLPESMISDRRPQFMTELTKKLNRILEIEIKLLTAFYPQIDG